MMIILKGLWVVKTVSTLVKFFLIELAMTKEAFSDARRLKSEPKRGKHQFW